ncbi:lamin tail domain-containing protein [Fodinibius sp. AD559]|uniref:lamin tail domain-containing protein n=1 Tax=Fodinibius sp. AD559 TaxID=3424179 RepID=UPI004046A496
MGIGLLSKSFFKTFFVFALLLGFALQEGYSQSSGDIAVVGFNSDGDDDFAITTFVDIPSGTTIYFSDRSWDGDTESFSGSEGIYSYTVPSGGFNAGSVITINPNSETASDGGAVSHISGTFNLTNGGDELYFYLSSADDNSRDTPSTFLFAVTNDNTWNNNELKNTGLVNGTTALSGIGDGINDNGEYIGRREGPVSILKEEIRKVEDNWSTTDGSGDQSISFDKSSFSLIHLPTVAFTTSAVEMSENSGTAELTVELVESNTTAVDVDVTFLSGSSTATNGEDFYDETGRKFNTRTISFENSEGDGTTKNITLNVENDSELEDSEKAIFQLQNISDGSIIGPDVLTLTIVDDDAPDIVINEVYADPTDGSGARDAGDDQFIEFVNNQGSDLDISGWKVFNESGLKHTFPDGTVFPANRAFILFGGDEVNPKGNYGGALIEGSNESATLSLDNDGDTIRLEDSKGNEVISLDYSSANNDQSIVRNPEIVGDFVDHSTVSDNDALFSPGTKADGKAFGSKYAIGMRGSAGWRMISTPTDNTSFADLFSNLQMQGIPGSDDPSGTLTLAGWSEEEMSFTAPSDMSNTMSPGKGYIVYIFEGEEFNTSGIQGGGPKVISTNGDENSSRINVTVSANNTDGENGIDGAEGWNLLGNPFGTDLSVGALIEALEDIDPVVNANIYVWDHDADGGNGKYITLSDGDLIAPFQAFFVRFTNEVDDQTFTFDKSALEADTETEFYKNNAENSFVFDVQLHGEEYFDTYTLEFNENGTVDLDRFDAYKLLSLNPNSINLFSTHGNTRLQKSVLPEDLEGNLEIPLSFKANGRTNLTFRWEKIDKLPNKWDVMLIDKETDREIDLRTAQEYRFTILSGEPKETIENKKLLNKRKASEKDPRFVLSVNPNSEISNVEDLPESVKLKPNYPNPFNPTTTIPYEITEDAEVKLTIWNMIGQKVATLVDGPVDAGEHEETWNATNMPSGIYIARFQVGSEVFTRKMTLIK